MLNRVIAKIQMLFNLVRTLINIISEGLDYITVSISIYQFDIFIILLFSIHHNKTDGKSSFSLL